MPRGVCDIVSIKNLVDDDVYDVIDRKVESLVAPAFEKRVPEKADQLRSQVAQKIYNVLKGALDLKKKSSENSATIKKLNATESANALTEFLAKATKTRGGINESNTIISEVRGALREIAKRND